LSELFFSLVDWRTTEGEEEPSSRISHYKGVAVRASFTGAGDPHMLNQVGVIFYCQSTKQIEQIKLIPTNFREFTFHFTAFWRAENTRGSCTHLCNSTVSPILFLFFKKSQES
jgi:hypothetical protein